MRLVGVIVGAEIFLRRTRLGRALERAPFLGTLAMKVLAYGAAIVFVVGGRLGRRLAVAGAAVLLGLDLAAAVRIYAATAKTVVDVEKAM